MLMGIYHKTISLNSVVTPEVFSWIFFLSVFGVSYWHPEKPEFIESVIITTLPTFRNFNFYVISTEIYVTKNKIT